MKYLLYYLTFINLYGIFIMYIDKKNAIKGKWRIPEKKLFFISSIFGSLGIFIGMYMFNHKTKHKKFTLGIPLILFLQVVILIKYIISVK
ncbi:uncharacterized membrane protein YsdA (DUF1294 family) [Clostridium tetanomorphum]|uniref:DUF1294 domain-containing protein n=1 Tax=Clostridium tetanomorphum TaxID=1553 RepID=A0A923E7Z8_CLOTT|nr:DUF1294 domain-containing protein [Clostridium tetanomorphum]KAJ53903.1 hypothetical protein CTM_00025 [Clostridium tetanomorphum DSM 665]MBC2398113.1 DUF1294 domain-containing protein [Clostridium tetanomorphum]MBP1864682.1 uncharacterized membrane protein YsdA (DUF1294 family) [Clostridium tetanomorphum]NRS84152.1 uncharacterized membrane protein YsdA (DUF1294 family) [Clostridium tetanomorphum]NRZ97365.1 uncharacterized membrane protein YsdA (DUF1294 family) [Clostridium tetanomorphum]